MNSFAASAFLALALMKKPLTPMNGVAASEPPVGIGSIATLIPAFSMSGMFHGPVRKYGDSPLLNESLAMSAVMLGLSAPAFDPGGEVLGELDAARVAQAELGRVVVALGVAARRRERRTRSGCGYRWYGSPCLGSSPTRKGNFALPASTTFLPAATTSSNVFDGSGSSAVLRTRATFSIAYGRP